MSLGSDGGDQYTGFDRFGRVIDQQWINGGGVTDRFRYTYDADGNVTYREVDTGSGTAAGQSYDYDNLSRLAGYTVGTVTDSNGDGFPDTLSSGAACQSWSLDPQGNWVSNSINGTAQTRGVNNQNQYTSVSSKTTPTYDNEGNMLLNENCSTYTYDAWNRLASQTSPGTTSNVYDALGHRLSDGSADDTTIRICKGLSCTFAVTISPFHLFAHDACSEQ